MTTARAILSDALTFRLNRLSPGETADADVLDLGLRALNAVADEMNGVKSFLFRELLTSGTVTGSTGTLGSTWATLSPGDEILGATYSDGTQDIPISRLTMQQYHEGVPQKSSAGDPMYWAHDGLATVYFAPAPTSRSVKLRTRQAVTTFADLDTDYSMPAGYRAGLADMVSERLAPVLNKSVAAACVAFASTARGRLVRQAIEPAIVNAQPVRPNIFTG